jgi:hypothetical protein
VKYVDAACHHNCRANEDAWRRHITPDGKSECESAPLNKMPPRGGGSLPNRESDPMAGVSLISLQKSATNGALAAEAGF